MSERAASSTAVLVCQGRAVAHGRHAVGVFSDPVAQDLLDDDERALVEAARAGHPPRERSQRMGYELLWRTGILVVPRTVVIDRAVVEHAAPQVVVLGAGLDARAWRMPELGGSSVFEVDHPASQRDKQRRLAGRAPTAARVLPVAVDLAHERLGPALTAAGFDPSLATTWVWEGVVPYLDGNAVRATVRQLAELSAAASLLVVSYQSRSVAALVMRRLMRGVMRVSGQADPLAGEPWRSTWSSTAMRSLLSDNGFDVRSDDDLLTLAAGLGLPPEGNASLRNGRVALAVRS